MTQTGDFCRGRQSISTCENGSHPLVKPHRCISRGIVPASMASDRRFGYNMRALSTDLGHVTTWRNHAATVKRGGFRNIRK
jgi:hypothetical protein